MRTDRLLIILGLIAAFMVAAFARLARFEPSVLTPIAPYATPIFIVATIIAARMLMARGDDLGRLGFAERPKWRHLVAALIAVAVLQAWSRVGPEMLTNLVELLGFSDHSYVQERFSDVQGSATGLARLLLLSWIAAAFGEELSFRIVLMRGLDNALGATRATAVIALVVSAVVFGAIHLYKGPVGAMSSVFSGLVFGVLVMNARGAIWPAVLAHGLNNTIGIVNIYRG